jgi:integrase
MKGLRRGEVCGLRWDDVDLDDRELRVRQSVITVSGKAQVDALKSARSRRTVSLDGQTERCCGDIGRRSSISSARRGRLHRFDRVI